MATVDAPPITVLVADDDPVTRAGLRSVLSGDPRFTVIGDTLMDEATLILRLRPNIVVTDPYPLHRARITLITDLVARAPMTSTCIYTSRSEAWAIVEAMRAGAQAYILKSSSSAEFLAQALYMVGRFGATVIDPRIAEGCGALVAENGLIAGTFDGHRPNDRERGVLKQLARGLTREQIAAKERMSVRTVERLIASLEAKLDAPSLFLLGMRAAQLGLRFDP